ncbi:hypothetical protein A2482_02500 [Candidatus Falkowbacteria bacterium RIFOXYC2_FULL_48_21]|uniref:Gas vesicle protein n=1 Tax=Candidatus Falkowbacteria bacterium RIFOXYC2_FULL_48_21 TaxID=1798005 RepID=A0A1F5T5N0_9BACT|nr:MAG: hypothetical protein A2482_02500 [Candidatus Falkowbacteria bacterium RIFOXYC2_FULL_48_21]
MGTKKFIGTLALGALIGGAIGLFLNPETGKKNRDRFKKLSKQVSEQLVREVGKAGKIGRKEYDAVVENIVKKYSKDDLLNKAAWVEIVAELKERWADIQKEVANNSKKKK